MYTVYYIHAHIQTRNIVRWIGTEHVSQIPRVIQCCRWKHLSTHSGTASQLVLQVRLVVLSVSVDAVSQISRMSLAEGARVENHLLNIACHAADAGSLIALLVVH